MPLCFTAVDPLLEPHEERVLTLLYLKRRLAKDVSEIMGIPPSRVRSIRDQGVLKLVRQALGDG